MCPPLQTADVLRAADKLSEHARSRELLVVDGLFRSDIDRVNLRNVIKLRCALQGLASGPQELIADFDPGAGAD